MSNILGITEEEMQARHNQYHRENPDQWAREDSTFTIQELAFGAGSRAGAAVAKVQASVCNMLSPTLPHCSGRVPRVHVNPGILGAYPCPMRVRTAKA